MFTGLANMIQNYLIKSVSNVVRAEIKKYITTAKLISIILDEATISVIDCIRFTPDGQVRERFLGVLGISNDRSAGAVYDIVEKLGQDFECENTHEEQYYDGASVTAGHINGYKSKLGKIFLLPYLFTISSTVLA
ncbi:hypothetical protein PR048_006622 [Dryococelus australis]|uniref:DUF4371 domain-containing protein n=1 Tax=Dryococelus australis TaxID=614101 RepID=A0ABQ9IBG7_9NEOP|nr:hypothetical protein PR048_006622 [Dryococelus australis]